MAEQAPDPSQPRQPYNLHGLLRFAMDATKSEDAPGASRFQPLDEERKRFLEEALNSMTVDVIEVMHKNILTLHQADSTSVDSDIQEYLDAFETILEYIDRIDTAIDFHKIGGFTVFPPCLNSVHAPIRAAACNLLAELVQNNAYCQSVALETQLLPSVLALLDKDPDEAVQVKALYAISCTVRENGEALKELMARGGLQVLCRAFQRPSDRLRTKAAFLLTRLCAAQPALVEQLVHADLVAVLVSILAQERGASHEHVVQLLRELAVHSEEAAAQCADSRLSLRHILATFVEKHADQPDYYEEVLNCEELLHLIERLQEPAADTDR